MSKGQKLPYHLLCHAEKKQQWMEAKLPGRENQHAKHVPLDFDKGAWVCIRKKSGSACKTCYGLILPE